MAKSEKVDTKPKSEKQIAYEKNRNRAKFFQYSQPFSSSYGWFKILGFIFGVLLLMAIISSMTGATSGVHTFEGLLQQLTTCPQIGTDWLNWGVIEFGDWGAFNFLAEFFESIALIVNFALYIITMLMNLVVFIIWFLGWIFGA